MYALASEAFWCLLASETVAYSVFVISVLETLFSQGFLVFDERTAPLFRSVPGLLLSLQLFLEVGQVFHLLLVLVQVLFCLQARLTFFFQSLLQGDEGVRVGVHGGSQGGSLFAAAGSVCLHQGKQLLNLGVHGV